MAFLLGAIVGGSQGISNAITQNKRPKIITLVGSGGGGQAPTEGQIYPTGR